MNAEEDKIGVKPSFIHALSDSQDALYAHIVILLGGDTETAKDVLQETDLSIWQRRDTFDPSRGTFLTWAKTMAYAQVMKERTRAQREHQRLVYTEEALDEVSRKLASEPEEPSDLILALRRCLNFLKRADRKLLNQHYVQRRPLVTLTQEWKMSLAAIQKKISRLRQGLNACIMRQMCFAREPDDTLPAFGSDLEGVLEHAADSGDAVSRGVVSGNAPFCIEQLRLHALLTLYGEEERLSAARRRRLWMRSMESAAVAAAGIALLLAGVFFLRRPEASPPAGRGTTPVAENSCGTEPVQEEPVAENAGHPRNAEEPLRFSPPAILRQSVPSESGAIAAETGETMKKHPIAIAATAAAVAAVSAAVAVPRIAQATAAFTNTVESAQMPLNASFRGVAESSPQGTLEARYRTTAESTKLITLLTTKFRGTVIMLM